MERSLRDRASGRATWHRKASRPVSLWMIALFFVVLFHRWIPDVRWLMVHLVALGLVANSILIWSQHFTEALLRQRLPDSSRPAQLRRILILNLSFLLLIAGMLTAFYPATLVGGIGVGMAVAWHALSLGRQLKTALPAPYAVTVRFYIIAAWLLPLGALFGLELARGGLPGSWYTRLQLAHEAVNLLGFVGLTVTGTLITLWPTILRTRMVEHSLPILRRVLTVLLSALVIILLGALTGWPWLAVAGLTLYALGLLRLTGIMVQTLKGRLPVDYAGLSVLCGVLWLVLSVGWSTVLVVREGFTSLDLGVVTPSFVVGFLVQILLGAMTYLLPVTMGGGPAAVRAGNRELNRFSVGRVALLNLNLALFCLPAALTGSWVRAVASILGAAALSAFIPLMALAVKAQVAQRRRLLASREEGQPSPAPAERQPSEDPAAGASSPDARGTAHQQPRRQLLAGVGLTAAGLAAALTADPSPLRRWGHQGPAGDGQGEPVLLEVEATAEMRFRPETLEAPAGSRVILHLHNADPHTVHDLVLANGASSGRVEPGGTAEVDVGVLRKDLEGWCSIIGHRALGMVLHLKAIGAADSADGQQHSHGEGTSPVMAAQPRELGADLDGPLGPGAQARSPQPPPPAVSTSAESRREHTHRLEVTDRRLELAPRVAVDCWTYNGDFMGPVIRAGVGHRISVELVNSGTMGHSIDFHAGDIAPDQPMRTIAPGESLDYSFTAHGAGIWLYHCATAPMSAHLAAGMFGAVIVDPPGLPAVDREYLLVQSETYLRPTGEQDEQGRAVAAIQDTAIATGIPSLTMFNGHTSQYRPENAPLTARVGERVRIWVLAAGPSLGCSFHVVGSQFRTVYREGAYLLRDERDAFGQTGGRAQALSLAPAQGGFVEMVFTEPGSYTFVNHDFAQAERGAKGMIQVSA